MDKRDVLYRAIDKAIVKGWDSEGFLADVWGDLSELERRHVVNLFFKELGTGYYLIIFSHDFAKSLWGQDEVRLEPTYPLVGPESFSQEAHQFYGDHAITTKGGHADGHYYYGKRWQWHLQQMVVADDPIAYLAENM